MDERLSVMRSTLDVTEFSEEHMIPILHTGQTAKLYYILGHVTSVFKNIHIYY